MSLDDSTTSSPTQPPPSPAGAPGPGATNGAPRSEEPDVGGLKEDGAQQSNTVSGITSQGDVTIENRSQTAGSIFNGDVVQIYEAHRRTTVRQFTCADGVEITEAQEEVAVRYVAGTEPQLEELAHHLEERRVLVLTAEQGARKVTAATHLAARLRRGGACARPPLLFDRLERHVRVDVPRLPLKHADLSGRVVIFRYAFSRGNPDLAAAFEKTDRVGWNQLVEHLRERGTYLVFTATPDEAERFREVPAYGGFARELAPHGRDLLASRLDEWLDALEARGGEGAARAATLRQHRDGLLDRFAFVPRLHDFVEYYAGLEPAPPVEDALARFGDGSRRLLHELDDDLDGWIFGFALALAHCTQDARGVPWVDFERLRRSLRQWLGRDLGRGQSRDEEDDDGFTDLRTRLSDSLLLTRSRAIVEKDPSTLADEIRFCDGKPSQRLWGVLLENYRGVLTGLVPRLRALAEEPGQIGRTLAELSAQILGRIGEIDPVRVVAPLVDEWLRTKRHAAIGALYEGVMGSGDARYRARCLKYLKQMHDAAPEPAGKGPLEAAVAVYSWIGYHDLPLAMRELASIARAHLVPMIEDAAEMSRLAARVQSGFEELVAGGSEAAVEEMRAALRTLVDHVYQKRGGVFLGVQATLVSLCGTRGVVPVLRELRGWIAQAGAAMGVLVALMFLHERGVAAELRDDRAELPGGEGGTCGQMVLALSNGEEDVRQAARFIGDLYDSVTAPWATEAAVRRHVRGSLEAHLQEWVREALPVPELAASMRQLLEHLARTHDGKLRELVVQLVTRGDFTRNPEMAAFAATLRL